LGLVECLEALDHLLKPVGHAVHAFKEVVEGLLML
jgi:hypothetical protein